MILGIDLGTTAVKAVVWGVDGPLGVGRAGLVTTRPGSDRAEQDASTWWPAVVAAVRDALSGRTDGTSPAPAAPVDPRSIDAIGFSVARQTVVAVGADLAPLGPALVWSDRRAPGQAAVLARALGTSEEARRRTGVTLDAAAVAAKIAWLAEADPEAWRRARWLLGPRDMVAAVMTGRVVSDRTVASRSGLYDRSGAVVPELAGPAESLLPDPLDPYDQVGTLRAGPAGQMGLVAGTPVVAGAGDRACEALGSGASAERPMVSWGTTANLSVPVTAEVADIPAGLVLSAAAGSGYLLEGGVSGAGSALAWLAGLTGTGPEELARAAAGVEPGASGVVAVPWIDGARAPWWRPEAAAAFLGLTAAHTPADLARAIYEGVAVDLARCLDTLVSARVSPTPLALLLCGTASSQAPWPSVLAGVTGLPVAARRVAEAGSAGAALIAAAAVGAPFDLDRMNPPGRVEAPDPAAVARYAGVRRQSDRAVRAVLDAGLDAGLGETPDPR